MLTSVQYAPTAILLCVRSDSSKPDANRTHAARGRIADTRVSAPAIEMVNQEGETLCRNPEQGHPGSPKAEPASDSTLCLSDRRVNRSRELLDARSAATRTDGASA